MIYIVDASVAAMWFLPEPLSETAASLLQSEHELVAPELMRLEVGSALLKATRRGAIDAVEATEAFSRLTPPVIRFESLAPLIERAFSIAEYHGGSIYDGIYVALAASVAGMVVTNDAELVRTARAASVGAWSISDPMPDGGAV